MGLNEGIRTYATAQHGLITRHQLRMAGAVRDDVLQRLREGMLQRISPCVFRIGGSADSPAQRALAAGHDAPA